MKLDLKELIAKVISGYGTPITVDLNNNWTPTTDGIMLVYVGWNVDSYGYMYIKDYTTNEWVGMISNANALGGFSETTSFPVIKGHTYKVDMQSKVGDLKTTFYPLS